MEPQALSLIAAGSAGALMLRVVWDRFLKKSDSDASKLEEERDAKDKAFETRLSTMQEGLAQIHSQLAVLIERLAFNSGEFRKLDERQAGMSANYGTRLSALEAEVVRLRTYWEMQQAREAREAHEARRE